MELLVSHVIVGLLLGVTGLCAGWWLHGRLPDQRSLPNRDDFGLMRELMANLHRLSHGMAADVNQHNTEVGAVDRELSQMRNRGATKVAELVERLIVANRSVQAKLNQTEGKLEELSGRIEYHANEARTDVLTGLANRRAFQEEAACRNSRFQDTGEACSLVMIDIDRFKQVNDVYGHPFGDEVLRTLGATLRDQFRRRDLVTRYGGEEFAVLMPHTEVGEARRLAEAVREAVERTQFEFGDKSLHLTVSLGVAQMLPQETMPDLLKRADQALYAAKHSGRNRVYWHDGNLPHPLRMLPDRTEAATPEVHFARTPETTLGPRDEEAIAEEAVLVQTAAALATEPPARTAEQDAPPLRAEDVDPELLQNVGNKTMFCQNIHRRIAEFNGDGTAFAALLLRVDNASTIVRTHGEQNWQTVLGAVVQAARARLRKVDLLARYDDRTFGIVVPDASLRDAICIAERVRKDLQQTTLHLDSKRLQFTVSLGVVAVADGDVMATLVERAGDELDRAQASGGNRTGFSASSLLATN